MATKVKPSRLNVTGTPQAGDVPMYVDADSFQWGAGGGGNVKSFTLSSTSDLTTAQEAYDWYDDGNVAIIIYNDKEYLFNYATAGDAYWSVANDDAYDTASSTGIQRASLQLTLNSGTVTAVTTLNITVNNLNVLRTDKNYGTPYTPQYDGSPATKKYVDDAVNNLMGLGKFLSLWDATTGLPISFPLQTPYTYTTGDYFLVETVSSATPPVNYRPTGSSYTGTASSTPETDELEVGDVYIYDGSTWLLQSNHGKTVSFSNIAGDAMDNANLSGYLNMKAFYLSSTSDLTTAQAAFDWQNGGKTAIVVYNDKPYAFSYYNTASMAFACLFYREQLEAGNNKTSLVRDVITFSMTGGTTVSSISATGWNNIMASVLKTDTDYANPYTPQYNGSPATKKYVDDHGVPSGGNNGDVLTNVSGTPTWQAISGGHDYSWNTLTGTTLSITGSYYRNQISTSSNLTVSAGTGLTPGMEYILRVVNSDSSNAITMTWDSVAYTIPAGGEINFKFMCIDATTLDFDGPRIVATTPASFDSGKIYFEI